jgi:hypothetical protein
MIAWCIEIALKIPRLHVTAGFDTTAEKNIAAYSTSGSYFFLM